LEDRFAVGRRAGRLTPARKQTLRASIEWNDEVRGLLASERPGLSQAAGNLMARLSGG
jgi:predicted ATPase